MFNFQLILIPGSQMIVAMKLISIGFDVDQGTIKEVPDIIEYTGYCMFAGSVVFGPWISYSTYLQSASGVELVSVFTEEYQ